MERESKLLRWEGSLGIHHELSPLAWNVNTSDTLIIRSRDIHELPKLSYSYLLGVLLVQTLACIWCSPDYINTLCQKN
jgi:hypothetical protein